MPRLDLKQNTVDKLVCQTGKSKTDYFDSRVSGLLVKVASSGSKNYYLRFQNNHGKWTEKKLAKSDASVLRLSDAREIAQKKLLQIAQGEDPFEEARRPRKQAPTLQQFVTQSYMPHIKGYKRSWETDDSLLRNHILPAVGHLVIGDISRQDMVDLFSDHRLSHKPASTNRTIILCRYIFNCAIRWEVEGIKRNPTHEIPLYPQNNQRERYLNAKEAARLFDALEQSKSKHIKNIVTMLLLTGARRNEVLCAKWNDFDLEKRIWTIEFNKAGRTRYVPLSDGMLQLLDQIPRDEANPYLFPSPVTGKPLKHTFSAWHSVRREAGLADLRIHDLRHSFASFLINNGRSLYEVQKILGHTQVKTTQRYSHLSQDSLIAAANTAANSIPLAQIMPSHQQRVPLVAVQQ